RQELVEEAHRLGRKRGEGAALKDFRSHEESEGQSHDAESQCPGHEDRVPARERREANPDRRPLRLLLPLAPPPTRILPPGVALAPTNHLGGRKNSDSMNRRMRRSGTLRTDWALTRRRTVEGRWVRFHAHAASSS